MTTLAARPALALSAALTLGLMLVPAAALQAETLVIGDQVQLVPSSVARPARGSTMSAVEMKFGAPQNRHPTVGTPPITRWDYAGFSVFFEKDRVIDAVATGD
jgi:hypothetical protein